MAAHFLHGALDYTTDPGDPMDLDDPSEVNDLKKPDDSDSKADTRAYLREQASWRFIDLQEQMKVDSYVATMLEPEACGTQIEVGPITEGFFRKSI